VLGHPLFLEAPAGTQQIAEGELKVNFPIVGRNVERAIVGGLERHVAGEAAAIEAWVAEHPEPRRPRGGCSRPTPPWSWTR